MVFVNKDGEPVGKELVCFDCGGNHYKGDPSCPKDNKLNNGDDDYSTNVSHSLQLAFVGVYPCELISRHSIILDNQSSILIFKSRHKLI
jgi:hypothetical protein